MGETSPVLEDLANVATVATAFIAGLALVAAWAQLTATHRSQAEATAKTLYRQYLQLAFENPKFANPDLAKFDWEARTIDSERAAFERYEWFVAMLVLAAEEILAISNEKAWFNTLLYQLTYHRSYFGSRFFKDEGYIGHYSAPVRDLIEATQKKLDSEA